METIKELQEVKSQGRKFSVTLDELTSAANIRFMNVNLHLHNQFWNFWLQEINGSFTSEACLAIFMTKLHEFNIRMEFIFGVVTDEASVMKKFGRISERQHIPCMAHGIHLGVTDLMYKKRTTTTHSEPSPDSVDSPDTVESLEEPNCDETDFQRPFIEVAQDEIEYAEGWSNLIKKVRKVITMFTNSPLKESILKNYSPNGKKQN